LEKKLGAKVLEKVDFELAAQELREKSQKKSE